jgi:hypothetical protein
MSLRRIVILLAACAPVLGGAGVAGAASSTPTAASVIAASTAALSGRSGVHVVIATVNSGTHTSAVADIGLSAGHETYTSGTNYFDAAVTKKAAYLSGSTSGLETLMGLTAKQAKKVGSSWITMKAGSTQYKQFWLNLTAKGFAGLLPTAKGTTLLPARDASTGGYQLQWSTKATTSAAAATTVLVISAGRHALPLRETVTTKTGSSVTTFSHWGEKVHFSAPHATVAYSKVFG